MIKKVLIFTLLTFCLCACDNIDQGMQALESLEKSVNKMEALEAIEPLPEGAFKGLFPETINNTPQSFGNGSVRRYQKEVLIDGEPRYEYTMVIQDLADPSLTMFIMEFDVFEGFSVESTEKDGSKLIYSNYQGFPRIDVIPDEFGTPSIKVLVKDRFILVLNGQWDATYEHLNEALKKIDLAKLAAMA